MAESPSTIKFVCCVEDDRRRRTCMDAALVTLVRVQQAMPRLARLPSLQLRLLRDHQQEEEKEERDGEGKEGDGRWRRCKAWRALRRLWLQARREELALWRGAAAEVAAAGDGQAVRVPGGSRREWLETALVLQELLCVAPLALCWFLPTAPGASAPQSQQRWELWEDRRRRLGFLSCRLREVRGARVHAMPLRAADAARMDAQSFAWRVKLLMWHAEDFARLCVRDAADGEEALGSEEQTLRRAAEALAAAGGDGGSGGGGTAADTQVSVWVRRQEQRRAALSLWGRLARRRPVSLAALRAMSGEAEAEAEAADAAGDTQMETRALLARCCAELAEAEEAGRAPSSPPPPLRPSSPLCGALRFRMLLELCVARLAGAAPRCTLSWRLLAQSLAVLAARVARREEMEGGLGAAEAAAAAALLSHMGAYITCVLLPFLYSKDRHVDACRTLVRDTGKRLRDTDYFQLRPEGEGADAASSTTQHGMWRWRRRGADARSAAAPSLEQLQQRRPGAGGSGAPDAAADTGGEEGWAAHCEAAYDCLQRACGYDPRGVGGGGGDGGPTAVLRCEDGDGAAEASAASAVPEETVWLSERLFTSESARRRLLVAFLKRYFAQSPVTAFWKANASASSGRVKE